MKFHDLQYLPPVTLAASQTVYRIQRSRARPGAASWPVLQSLRFSATQAIAAGALEAGFEGIAYRSAQHYGQDCFVVFGASLKTFKLVWRKPLMLPDGSMHQALATAIRGGQVALAP